MISNKEVKLITSLSKKKGRNKHQLFIAEGDKLVNDLLNSSFSVEKIYFTSLNKHDYNRYPSQELKESELKKISQLNSPSKVVGIFIIPKPLIPKKEGLIVALDGIKDPGNLGTIIRLCDWFGVSQIICSNDTVDCYNPKVVQASMGSISRITVNYLNLENYLKDCKMPIMITDMLGDNIYKETLSKEGILVMGNEGNGISTAIKNLASHMLFIPRFGENSKTESLNVAMATAILLSELRR